MNPARMLGNRFTIVIATLLTAVTPISIEAQTVPQNEGSRPGTPQAGQTRPAASQPSRQPVRRPTAPRPPEWIPLPPQHAQFLDQVLQYWQDRTSKISRFRCRFKRYEYDSTFGPGSKIAKTYAEGEIQYSSPDKGLFRTTLLKAYVRDKDHPQGAYIERPLQADHWICDGKSVFKFDYNKKVLTEQILPPEYRGRAITRGPLPFLFGADANDIKRRYWMRIITPADRTQGENREYWIQAIPKTQEDAADYRAINIMIDGKDFLPNGMVLYGRVVGSSQSYRFEKREVNFSVLAEKLNLFHRQFYEPKLPASDWKKVVHGVQQAQRSSR